MAAFVVTFPLCAPAATTTTTLARYAIGAGAAGQPAATATTLACYALGAGAAGRRGDLQAVLFPAGWLIRRGGRRAVVVAAAAGGSGDGPAPPFDGEAVVGAFRLDMEMCRLSKRPLAFLFLGAPELNPALTTARNSMRLLECLLANEPVDAAQYKELVRAGKALVILEAQCAEGYMRADALVDATQGLKLAGAVFFPDSSVPENVVALSVPLTSAEVADMDGYLRDLVEAFIIYYGHVGWEAHVKYNFNIGLDE